MSIEATPRCDNLIGGKKCGKIAAAEPTRIMLDDRDGLEGHLCDDCFGPVESLYSHLAQTFRKIGGMGDLIKRAVVNEEPLFEKRLVGPPSKRRQVYFLYKDEQLYTPKAIRAWLVARGLMPEFGEDGKPKRGLIPDHLAQEWARNK